MQWKVNRESYHKKLDTKIVNLVWCHQQTICYAISTYKQWSILIMSWQSGNTYETALEAWNNKILHWSQNNDSLAAAHFFHDGRNSGIHSELKLLVDELICSLRKFISKYFDFQLIILSHWEILMDIFQIFFDIFLTWKLIEKMAD